MHSAACSRSSSAGRKRATESAAVFDSTHEWWTALRVVSAVNVLAWAAAAWWTLRQRDTLTPQAWASRRLRLLLCAGYVFGCAWRSLLPVYDVQRIVMVDSWWSSVIVGRTVATIAELCFAAQWALLLREAAAATASRFARAVSRALVPMIVVAETCSWHAVLTTANLGHVVEETLWGLCAALLAISLLAIWPRAPRSRRPLLAFLCAAAAVYVAYMFAVDVPMYWARWIDDQAQGRAYFGVLEGVVDASTRWTVTQSWDVWRGEVTWMTLYFSVAVWISIALVHLPRMRSPVPALASGR
jgi:hypothetical protein